MKILTQDKDFFPSDLKDKFQAIKSMGFDGIELDGKHLLYSFEEVKQAIDQTILPVVTVCGGYRGWLGDFNDAKRQQCLDDISLILERLSSIGGKGIVVPAAWGMFSLRLPPMVPPRNEIQDEIVILDSLQKLNQKAQEVNQTIFLEPLNRYEDHLINTVAKASYYIEKGKFSNVKIIADVYHMNIEEANIFDTLNTHKNLIQHIHFADNQRFQPGSGQLNFQHILKILDEINYQGDIAFECRVQGSELAYKQSLDFIKSLI